MDRLLALEQEIKAQCPTLMLRQNEKMAKHTSFRIGGPARLMAFPKTEQELSLLCRLAAANGVTPYIMGNGSNLLVADKGIDGFVIQTFDGLSALRTLDDGVLFAGSGVLLSRVATFAKRQGLSGLEFAHGIPGTVGGAATMNAGAYGGEMKDIVFKTEFCDLLTGEMGTVEGDAHAFVYRGSAFSKGGRVVTGVYFRLTPGSPEAIGKQMDALSRRRRESQPLDLPSAGSTFKRPQGAFAAALIDQAGLKGLQVGGARVSDKHGGFVVNAGGATCKDVLELIAQVKRQVQEQFGVLLELEVKVWGMEPPCL
ncbi:MAG: UDP-N-acetylmuramate dehydrogenase [Oscillospiraceae bacterium]|jgi:UDP-N-acetylmuramate dehydrogenase